MQNQLEQTEARNFSFRDLENAIKEEIFSPSILPYKRELINDFIAKVNIQESLLKENDEGNKGSFKRDILLLELDRAKYFLKKYLRARLAKIEKFILYIFQNDLSHLMSKAEFKYAVDYFKMITKQFGLSFFNQVDKNYGEKFFMNNVIENKSNNMFAKIVDAPNEGEYVFARVLEPNQKIVIDRINTVANKNEILFIPYKYVKQNIQQNKCLII